MCTPYRWQLGAPQWYEVSEQRMGAASTPAHHYWCGADRKCVSQKQKTKAEASVGSDTQSLRFFADANQSSAYVICPRTSKDR